MKGPEGDYDAMTPNNAFASCSFQLDDSKPLTREMTGNHHFYFFEKLVVLSSRHEFCFWLAESMDWTIPSFFVPPFCLLVLSSLLAPKSHVDPKSWSLTFCK